LTGVRIEVGHTDQVDAVHLGEDAGVVVAHRSTTDDADA
jgi:hypothetical protein